MTRVYPLALAALWFAFAAYLFVAPHISRASTFGWVAVLLGVLNLARWGVRFRRRPSR